MISDGLAEWADLVNDGTASVGMIAKLRACEHALEGGVDDVVIVDGRNADALRAAAITGASPLATRIGVQNGSLA